MFYKNHSGLPHAKRMSELVTLKYSVVDTDFASS